MIMFATDFADQAVVLPVAAVVLLGLLMIGWRRGALAWAGSVAGVLAIMLVLKILVFACGSLLPWRGLDSPSGHTAASAVVYGGLLALIAPPTRWSILAAATAGGAFAILIASTRLALGVHTLPDVVVGAIVGTAGAAIMRALAGERPRGFRASPLLLVAALVMVLFHGVRMEAETRIRWAAAELWPLSLCRGSIR